MYTEKYFEDLLKKKRKFSLNDIAKMSQKFVGAYVITGHIDRYKLMDNIDKVNKIRKKIMPNAKPLKWGIDIEALKKLIK